MSCELERSLIVAQRLTNKLSQSGLSRQESKWAEAELKKCVRAIYWAADDYQHTLSILNLDPNRSNLSVEDRLVRSEFAQSARQFADEIRVHVLGIAVPPLDNAQAKVHHKSLSVMASGSGSYKYSLLQDADDDVGGPSGSDRFEDILLKQQQIVRDQDDNLELVGNSVHTLKNMSYRIGDELDQQAIMLEDLGQDMERVDTKLDGVMKKIAKLSHLDDDKRQCKAIIILSAILFFLVFILIVL